MTSPEQSVSTMTHDVYHSVRNVADRLPLMRRLARVAMPEALRSWLYRRHFDRKLTRMGEPRAIFEKIYELNWWNSSESRSGPGSELAATSAFRRALTEWLERHKDEIGTFLDAPCGDFNWMRYVPLPAGTAYVGGDIVAALVTTNQASYGNAQRRFLTLDVARDALPAADAWLCRDLLFHLPYAMGCEVIEAFKASDTRYFLSTTFPDARNDEDIPVGWYRNVNLALDPYGLGEPVELLPDPMPDAPDRVVGVWKNPRFA